MPPNGYSFTSRAASQRRRRQAGHVRSVYLVLPDVQPMTTVKVLGAMAMGSLAMAAALTWLLVARPDRLLLLIW